MDRRRWGWVFGVGLGVAIAPGVRVQAQIVPDGSLGSEGSVTTPIETGVQIDGGALRGDNLFHSFQEFSIPTNSEAFFNNPDVANIFSRVTGGSISDIDGLLRANAGTVELRDGARLSSTNAATSNANDFTAGDVFVQADRLHLSDRADISANTGCRGGNVRLDTGTTILRRGSTIQTNAEGDFPGGNIIIDTDALVALENSDITATSDLGAEFSGSVELNTPEVDTATGLVDLSANPIDVAALLDTDPCTLGRESEFYVTGRGGLPPNPDGSLATETTWVDWRSLEDNSSETAMARDEEMALLVEAQGWHVNGEGSVVLSAQTPDGSPTPPQRMPAHCSPLTPTP